MALESRSYCGGIRTSSKPGADRFQTPSHEAVPNWFPLGFWTEAGTREHNITRARLVTCILQSAEGEAKAGYIVVFATCPDGQFSLPGISVYFFSSRRSRQPRTLRIQADWIARIPYLLLHRPAPVSPRQGRKTSQASVYQVAIATRPGTRRAFPTDIRI